MKHIENNLYIGGIKDVSPVAGEDVDFTEFDRVVTLGDVSTPYTTEQYEVGRQSWKEDPFFAAVNTLREIYRKPQLSGFAHCQVGVNRVMAVTATAIAAEDEISFEDAIRKLEEIYDADVDEHGSHRQIAHTYLSSSTHE